MEYLIQNKELYSKLKHKRKRSQMIKVSIIGAEALGATIAYILAQKGLYDINLIDPNQGQKAAGKALDIIQSLAVKGESVSYSLKGSEQLQDVMHSDVIVIATGQNYSSQRNILYENASTIKDIAPYIKQYAPEAFVIVATQPVDSMAWHFQKLSDLPENKVVGLSGVLNAGRFKYYLSQRLKINVCDIHTFVIGAEHDQMLPLIAYTTLSGIPLVDYIEKNAISLDEVHGAINDTKKAQDNMFALLKESSYIAPAEGCVKILEAYVFDKKCILSCSLNLNVIEPENDVYIGLPCIIGSNGVEEICSLKLSTQEEINFRQSLQTLLKQNIELSFGSTFTRKKVAG